MNIIVAQWFAGGKSMARKDDVLNMQIILMPVLAKAWHVSYPELGKIVRKYDVMDYIDAKYDMYNSTGTEGVVDDLTDYVRAKGARVA